MAVTLSSRIGSAPRSDDIRASAARRQCPAAKVGSASRASLIAASGSLSDDVDAVIVELGANDALRGLPPPQARAALDGILARLAEKGRPTLVAGMRSPPNMGPDYVSAFDGMYPELAKKYQAILYPFFLDGVAAEPRLNQADGIHPNAEGVAVIVRAFRPHVVAALGQGGVAR